MMNKLTTYVLMVSEYFPSLHPRNGEETEFPKAILEKRKIHTLRGNYLFWKKRFDKIEKGEACLSIRKWYGKPYNSKQIEITRLTRVDGIGLQKAYLSIDNLYHGIIEGIMYNLKDIEIAKNDGLSIEDFDDWFIRTDLSGMMAIIHFTEFRY